MLGRREHIAKLNMYKTIIIINEYISDYWHYGRFAMLSFGPDSFFCILRTLHFASDTLPTKQNRKSKRWRCIFIVCFCRAFANFGHFSTIFPYLFLFNPIQLWLWNKRNESCYSTTINGFGNDADTIQNHWCRREFRIYPPITAKSTVSNTNDGFKSQFCFVRIEIWCDRVRADQPNWDVRFRKCHVEQNWNRCEQLLVFDFIWKPSRNEDIILTTRDHRFSLSGISYTEWAQKRRAFIQIHTEKTGSVEDSRRNMHILSVKIEYWKRRLGTWFIFHTFCCCFVVQNMCGEYPHRFGAVPAESRRLDTSKCDG